MMKKLCVLFFTLASFFDNASCQLTKIGGGLNFGTGFHYTNEASGFERDLYRSPLTGLYLKAVFESGSPFNISPSFVFFLPRSNKVPDVFSVYKSTRTNELMLNLDGNYAIFSPGWMEVYGLAGVNITVVTIKWSDAAFSPGVDNAIGLNIGAGINLKLSEKISINSEGKFIAGKYHQMFMQAGVMMNFSLKKQETRSKK